MMIELLKVLSEQELATYSEMVDDINARLCLGKRRLAMQYGVSDQLLKAVRTRYTQAGWKVLACSIDHETDFEFSPLIAPQADNKPADYPCGVRPVST